MYLMVLNRTLKMVKEVNFILCVFYHNKKMGKRASLVVRWLRLCAPNAEAEVWSLVSTLRSHMLHSAALKNKQTNKPLTAQKMLTIICAFSES